MHDQLSKPLWRGGVVIPTPSARVTRSWAYPWCMFLTSLGFQLLGRCIISSSQQYHHHEQAAPSLSEVVTRGGKVYIREINTLNTTTRWRLSLRTTQSIRVRRDTLLLRRQRWCARLRTLNHKDLVQTYNQGSELSHWVLSLLALWLCFCQSITITRPETFSTRGKGEGQTL